MKTTAVKTWWVVIEKQWGTDEMYGPYIDSDAAMKAMEESPAIDYSCQEDSLECYAEEYDWIEAERRFKGQHKSTFRRSMFLGREVFMVNPTGTPTNQVHHYMERAI